MVAIRPAWPVVAGALGLVAVWSLLRVAGIEEAGGALGSVDPRTLVAAAVLELVAIASLAQVYRATFRVSGGRIDSREAAVVGLGAVSLTQLLPGGGVAGGIYATRRLVRAGADPVAATATVLLTGAVTLGTLALMVTLAATVGALSSPGYLWHAVAGAVAVTVMVGAIAALRLVLGRDQVRARAVTWLRGRHRGGRLAASLADDLETHRELLRRPAVLLPSGGWAAAKWAADLAVLALFVHALDVGVPLLGVVVAYAVANLLNGLPLTPGGLGVVEVGAVGTLVAFGGAPALATVAVLGYRAMAIGFPLLLAVPVVGGDLRRRRRDADLQVVS